MKNNASKRREKKASQMPPTAVLLMAYGSPENLAEVEPYYIHIRGGVRPNDALIKNLEDRYRQVGGKTPLHEITRDQAAHLQDMLDKREGKGRFKVFIGMKHWNPFIKETFEKMSREGIEKVIALALAPHYSKISIGGYQKSLEEAAAGMTGSPKKISYTLVESWHTNPYLIDCIADQLKESLKEFAAGPHDKKPHVIFTAHSLPERIKTWSDPYPEQLLETCRLIAEKMAEATATIEWSFAFQSAGMTGEPWLGPDINDVLAAAKKKGIDDIIICPIGFVSDNLEIIYDLDIESQALAAREHIHLKRTPLRNVHPLFIEVLYEEAVKGANL
jgi:ferrochelatase